jgi:small subunit ribosomal protein S11
LAKQDKAAKKSTTRTKKKITRTVPSGVAHVKATFNNTIVTITDPSGNVISWASAGKTNFTGSRKSSAFAASVAAQDAGKIAMNHGMKEVEVSLKGPGSGRESAVRGLQSAGLIITMIKDKTPIPHNGCRPRKRRRV